jgi:hypothetical protein
MRKKYLKKIDSTAFSSKKPCKMRVLQGFSSELPKILRDPKPFDSQQNLKSHPHIADCLQGAELCADRRICPSFSTNC